MTHLDAIIRGCFGAGLLDPGCSSLARYRFKPSLGSEGSDKLERPPPADSGGTAEGLDGAGRPVSAGSGAAVEGPNKARRYDSDGFEAAVEGPDAVGRFISAGSRGTSSPSCLTTCHRKGPTYNEGGSSSLVARSSHGMGDMEPSSSSASPSSSSSSSSDDLDAASLAVAERS